jgi:hypothetical protein
MSELYQITAKLHTTIQSKAKEFGKVVDLQLPATFGELSDEVQKIAYDRALHEPKPANVIALEYPIYGETQIKQILIAFSEELGSNPISEVLTTRYHQYGDNKVGFGAWYFYENLLNQTPQSQAEALYQRFCCGFPQSGFEKDPVKVLMELEEIISKLKK